MENERGENERRSPGSFFLGFFFLFIIQFFVSPPWVCINFIEGFLRKSEKEKRGKGCRSPAKETWIGDGRKEKEWENVILLGFYFFFF